MKHLLVTGMSGVGKSTALAELRSRGIACIDMDEPSLSFLDEAGHQHWRIDALLPRLDALRAEVVFVFGCAEEQALVADRFRAVILLSVPEAVMIERIRSRPPGAHGHDPREMARILADLREVEPLLRRAATHEIVTTIPVAEVVERLLAIASEG